MEIQKILEDCGLTQKQTRLYLSCLELGSASAYKISKRANLPRSTCYELLDVLKEKGMVSSFYRKKTKYYTAEGLKKVIEREKEKIGLLEKALPQLNAMYNSADVKPVVRSYQGVSGIKILLKELLSEAEEVWAFNSIDNLFNTLEDYWPEFLENRIKKKIPVKAILVDSPKARERKQLGPQQLREVRIISKEYNHNGCILIWKDKVCMFSFKKDLVVLIIESKEIAQSQKMILSFIWNSLEEH